ncbi:hypothetical protein H0H92_014813 [Tricholoma furcatifolium]|nr:hypothetical protein H0H92_014813 [Tricholoma furcatifolium]
MAFNGTSASDPYAATDFTSLNWLEQQWTAWYIMIGNSVIATGLMGFLHHEAYFRRWKLQPDRIPTTKEQWECTKLVLFSHFTMKLPMYSAPFGLAATYSHPVETVILGTGTVLGPFLYCYFTHDFHVVTMYVWITLRLLQDVDAHSGYDFPWSLHNILPFWSGAEHHDFHHMAFTNNYSASFRWWDRICGTDDKYREYRARITAAKKAMKYVSKKDQDEMEKKFLAVEAEGQRAEAKAEGLAPKILKVH